MEIQNLLILNETLIEELMEIFKNNFQLKRYYPTLNSFKLHLRIICRNHGVFLTFIDDPTEFFPARRKFSMEQLLSETEIQEIDQMLNQFQNKLIQLKDILIFFKVTHFLNYYYVFGNDEFRQEITEEQSAIAVLFEYDLEPLVLYNEFKKYLGTVSYIVNTFRRMCPGTHSPVNFPRVCLD